LRTIIGMQLPKVFGSERLDSVIDFLSSMKEQNTLVLNWKNVSILEPAALAIMAVIRDQSIEKKSIITHVGLKKDIRKEFPQECFSTVQLENLPKPSAFDFQTNSSFLLCCQGGIDLRYKQILDEKFSYLNEDLLFSIQLVFNELIQNAVDHSTSERYYIYFGVLEDEVHFGVLDMGVSLPAKMEQKYSAENDIEFLEMSLKEGTSTRRQRTGGLGLFHTFEIIKDVKGKFVFISRDGQVRRYFAQRKVKRLKLKSRLYGTWVMFTFHLKQENL